jgi:hypothetical protein
MAAADPFNGPIPIKNAHPLYIGLLVPPPENGNIVHQFTAYVSVDYTNIWLFSQSDEWTALMDKEVAEGGLTLRTPIWDQIEGGISITAIAAGPGILDGTVRTWHEAIGAPAYNGQAESPDYRFVDALYVNGVLIRSGPKNQTHQGDTTVWIKARLGNDMGPPMVAQFFIQAPTGNADAVAGSGAWEFGARVIGDTSLDVGLLTASIGVMLPNRLITNSGELSLAPMVTGFVAYEYPIARRVTAVIQSQFNTSPLPDAKIYQYAREFVEVTLGFAWRIYDQGPVLLFGFSENLNKTNPDFTLHLSLRYP